MTHMTLPTHLSPRLSTCRLSTRRLAAAVCALACVLAGAAHAQVTPQRLYYGLDRPMPVLVELPDGAEATEATLRLYASPEQDAVDETSYGGVIAEAQAQPGEVDLAEAFESFWSMVNRPLVYVQAFADDDPVGAPMVLQAMRTPARARGAPSGVTFQSPPRPVFTGVRAYTDKLVRLETSTGEMTIRLRPDVAPNTAFNFRHLVGGGYYTDVIFHRILGPGENGEPGFVIQVGDPTGTGGGGPGYFVDLEPSSLLHDFGVVSMARTNQPDTNGSQIFICLSRERTAALDGQYTAFAEVVGGAPVIMDIATVQTDQNGRPQAAPPMIESARLIDAPPLTERDPRVSKPDADTGR